MNIIRKSFKNNKISPKPSKYINIEKYIKYFYKDKLIKLNDYIINGIINDKNIYLSNKDIFGFDYEQLYINLFNIQNYSINERIKFIIIRYVVGRIRTFDASGTLSIKKIINYINNELVIYKINNYLYITSSNEILKKYNIIKQLQTTIKSCSLLYTFVLIYKNNYIIKKSITLFQIETYIYLFKDMFQKIYLYCRTSKTKLNNDIYLYIEHKYSLFNKYKLNFIFNKKILIF